jgi:hypothetical protein
MPHPRHPRHPCCHPCCPHHPHAVIFAAPLTTPAGNVSRRAHTSIWGLTSPPFFISCNLVYLVWNLNLDLK